jgi:hypothetical protein
MTRKDELNEVVSLLEQAGWSPRVCDTMVHKSECPVRCGIPTQPGDDTPGNGITLPSDLVGLQPELFVTAIGDSMTDAGFNEGDLLRVRLNQTVHDCDIVVAIIDGQTTVKAFYTDGQGCRWLVPYNDRYDSIPLTEQSNLRLLGTVVGIQKPVVRASSAHCEKSIRRTLAHQQEPQRPIAEKAADAVKAVSGEVKNGRQWYAVYRTLVDHELQEEGCYTLFCLRVAQAVPNHRHLPVAKELGRLAVQSFRRRVALWRADDAPVGGQRFADYLRIARLTAVYIEQG